MLEHDRHCLALRSEWEDLDNGVLLCPSINLHLDNFRVAIEEVADSCLGGHFQEAYLINRWTVIFKSTILVLQRDTVVAKIDASEEVLERVTLSLIEAKFVNRFHHLFH